ncbi:primosomal protein N' [Paractinoplanes ovalisporus]|uniref:primosomal protein N' family DNA-binding protein n=1 Tax=Paractinoplanes ovalisporus TaxID=2810368 RepID=UPI0027DCFE60|nr:primosomal protein N' [Actinoplanes ovalisporus]
MDVPLAHLDRPFDYLVAAADDEAAQPGVRVKVRFAGQLISGFLMERAESSPHGGKLAYLDKVVSPEQVLDPEIAHAARAVADRYAGNLCDVLRLAVPPRHARVEAQSAKPNAKDTPPSADDTTPPTPEDQDAPHPEATPAATHTNGDPDGTPTSGAAGGAADGAQEGGGPAAAHTSDRPAGVLASSGPRTVRASDGSGGTQAGDGPSDSRPDSGRADGGADPTRAGTDRAGTDRAASGADTARADAGGADGGTDPTRAGTDRAASGADTARADAVGADGGTETARAGADRAGADRADGGTDNARAGAGRADGGTDNARAGAGRAGNGVDAARVGGVPEPGEWGKYTAGPAFLRALAEGRNARAVWGALPGEDWAGRIAEAAEATVRGGRGVVIVVADARDLERVDRALGVALGPGRHVALNAALGPAERYRRFLAASRHQVPVVVGTRAAMWAPVAKLGLVVIWDDGDDLHAEPRSPYPHAREVLLTRAQLADCAALVAGFARTGEGQLLLETGWAREISASRDVLRAHAPAIAPTGDDPQMARDPGAAVARLPSLAWETARQALKAGAPVLVQVPRRGYLPSIACADCRTPARCPQCSGPLGLQGARDVPTCHWCGRAAAAYSCPSCGSRRLRASITGARRTAEELGRAFPGTTVRTSGRDEILNTVSAEPAVVVATPGAEPVAKDGYGAILLLDAWALLTRSDLRAAEETMRRWLNAAALARPASRGGRVVVVADGSLATVQALIRWDPGWFALRELTERRELSFPPASRMASLTGKAEAVADFLNVARLPADTELLGPVPADEEQERMLLRVPRSQAAAMAHALHEAAAVRSAKKAPLTVRVEIDPSALF